MFSVVDQGSKHGTFVNGERVERKTLERNDRLEFGVREVAYVIFNPQHGTTNSAREFLSQISGMHISDETTDLEKLVLFLEAARKLNTIGVLDEILMTLLDVTLKLTRAERAYVYMKNPQGELRLAWFGAVRSKFAMSCFRACRIGRTSKRRCLHQSTARYRRFTRAARGSRDLTGAQTSIFS